MKPSYTAFRTLLSSGLLIADLSAADISWDSGGGTASTWSNAINWSADSLPSADDAVFVSTASEDTIFVDLDVSVGNFFFVRTGGEEITLDLGSNGAVDFETGNAFASTSSTSTAHIQLTSGSRFAPEYLVIGSSGEGYLTISEGLIESATYLTLGNLDGSYGELLVDGENSWLDLGTNLNVGREGNAVATFTNSSGTVAGQENHFDGDLRLTNVGADAEGTLNITNNAVVSAGVDLELDDGTGIINLTNGGVLNIGDDAFLAQQTTSTGTINVDDATFNVNDLLGIGYRGNATMSVTNGGTVNVSDNLTIGELAGATGQLEISGSQSAINTVDLYVGGFDSSAGGTGTFTINDGSVAASDTTSIYSGSQLILNDGSFSPQNFYTLANGGSFTHNGGTLRFEGGGWDFFNTADWILESANGSGTATVELSSIAVDHSDYDLTIGETSTGELIVDSGGSMFVDHLYLGAGDGGQGLLTIGGDISDYAFFQASNLTIGDAINGNGSASLTLLSTPGTVDGRIAQRGVLAIGDGDLASLGTNFGSALLISNSTSESGIVTVQGGAILDVSEEMNQIFIGTLEGEYGSMVISDDSVLKTSEDIFIGYSGDGRLIFSEDAELETEDSTTDVHVADQDGSFGLWENASGIITDDLLIGRRGDGHVTMGADDVLIVNNRVALGDDTDASGLLEMAADSHLIAEGIGIGTGGTGVVEANGAILDVETLDVGSFIGQGTMEVTDTTLNISNDVRVGLGTEATAFGVFTMSGGNLTTVNSFDAGASGNAEVTFKDGAFLSIGTELNVAENLSVGEEASLEIASESSSERTIVDIEGNASVGQYGTWTTDALSRILVGNGNTDTVSALGFVFVSDTTGAGGSLTMSDNDDPLSVSFDGELLVGWNSGETGTITMRGTQTVLTTGNDIRLGENGAATISLRDGALWDANGPVFDLGDETGAATITLDNGSELNCATGIVLGDDSGAGTIELTNDSALSCSFMILGDDQSTGSLTVDASTVTLSSSLDIGDGRPNQSTGDGEMIFQNGSTFNSDNAVWVAEYGTGSLIFDNSDWTDGDNGTARLNVGRFSSAEGSVELKNGAAVTIERVVVGLEGFGFMTVEGEETILTQPNGSGVLELGEAETGEGSLVVENGASHVFLDTTSNSVKIGEAGIGRYTVTGTGSSSQFVTNVIVGSETTAAGSSLLVAAGANFSGTTLEIENNCSATVEGSGTSMTLSGDLELDATGANTFTLQDHAILELAGALWIGSDDTFNLLTDATLRTDTVNGNLVNTSGVFSPGNSPARTTISDDYTQEAEGTLEIEIGGATAGTEYDVLEIAGAAKLNGAINVKFTDGFIPSGGESFTILTAQSIIDYGYSIDLPALPRSGLLWESTKAFKSITLDIEFTNDIEGFRAKYGLAEDGSDDFADWSGNGIENILYLSFGLGDPNEISVDRTRLPGVENTTAFGDFAVSFVQPKADVDLSIQLFTTNDLTGNFVDLDSLSLDHQPVETQTENLDQDYDRITQHFNFIEGEETRFYRLNVSVFEPSAD